MSSEPHAKVVDVGVHLILGPMFAGKTTELQRRIDRLMRARCMGLCLIKHRNDEQRSGAGLVSHNGVRIADDSTLVAASLSAVRLPAHTTHVFIDEGQFFPELAVKTLEWVSMGMSVTIAALNADANAHMWPEIAKLVPYDARPTFLSSVCSNCGNDAPCTRLRRGASPLPADSVRIGAQNEYQVFCVPCTLARA